MRTPHLINAGFRKPGAASYAVRPGTTVHEQPELLVARTVGNTSVITGLADRPAGLAAFKKLATATLNSRRTLAAPMIEENKRHSTIACIIPCYNEQDSIAAVLKALLAQTRLPDVIHVVVNNTDDETIEIATEFAGRHKRTVRGETFHTTVHIHDMGKNADKKVGALNFGFRLCRNYDFILGVDGDTTLDRHAVEWMELEMVDDRRIGGLSAIYTIDVEPSMGPVTKFLTTGQRAQFAAFNMDNMLRGRNMAVLGGQCSLFSVDALNDVMRQFHQTSPWVRDSEVEDSLLSLQIKKVGYSTKISAKARASVGGMPNLRALHGQQVKWNYGAIDLMWPGQRGNTKGQPLHPNLRLRWFENFTMLLNIATRLSFALLLAASLSISAYVFSPLWLIPPAVAVLLNVRIAMSIKNARASDILFALLFFPSEIYTILRMSHFAAAWAQFFARVDKDNWAAQSKAERGGGSSHLWPALVAVVLFVSAFFAWKQMDVDVKSTVLGIGWPILYVITIMQTLFMLKKVVRRHRGFST
ncbi:MAG: glycosyl transferase family 2 [Pseudonocardiales bacterium]|nr:glycosyl transferase family 2 [Pseudonocardiales bacterium]